MGPPLMSNIAGAYSAGAIEYQPSAGRMRAHDPGAHASPLRGTVPGPATDRRRTETMVLSSAEWAPQVVHWCAKACQRPYLAACPQNHGFRPGPATDRRRTGDWTVPLRSWAPEAWYF